MSALSLESLAGRILREHEAALHDARSAIEHARAAGKLLLEAKERCEPKKWESWVAENCSDIAGRTARKYMEIARHPEIEASSIKEALLKLSSSREPNKRPRVGRSQVIEDKEDSRDRPKHEKCTPDHPGEAENPTRSVVIGMPQPAAEHELVKRDDDSADLNEFLTPEEVARHDAAEKCLMESLERAVGDSAAEIKRLNGLLDQAYRKRDEVMNELRAMKGKVARANKIEKENERLRKENSELKTKLSERRAA